MKVLHVLSGIIYKCNRKLLAVSSREGPMASPSNGRIKLVLVRHSSCLTDIGRPPFLFRGGGRDNAELYQICCDRGTLSSNTTITLPFESHV